MTNEATTEIATTEVQTPADNLPSTAGFDDFSLLMDPKKFEHVQRVAAMYSKSSLLPKQYHGNVADCVIGIQMSMRLGIDPFMFLQNTYVIQGKPGMEAKLAIALVNKRGPFSGPIQYDFERDEDGKTFACTAFAIHKNGQKCSARVDWDMVVAEGWAKRPGSKWKTMPEQMFRYRSAVFMARAYCPEVLVGMHTADELEDIYELKSIDSSIVDNNTAAEDLDSRLEATRPRDPIVEQDSDTTGEDEPAETEEVEETDAPQAETKDQPNTEETTEATPADSGAPSPVDVLVETLAAKCECTDDKARARLERYCEKVMGADLADLNDGQIKSVKAQIDRGDIKV